MGPPKASTMRTGKEMPVRRNARRIDHQQRIALHSSAHEKLVDHDRLHAVDHDRMRGEGAHREDGLHHAAVGMDEVLLVADMDLQAMTGIEGTIDTETTTDEMAGEEMIDAMTVDKLPRRDARTSLKRKRRETNKRQFARRKRKRTMLRKWLHNLRACRIMVHSTMMGSSWKKTKKRKLRGNERSVKREWKKLRLKQRRRQKRRQQR